MIQRKIYPQRSVFDYDDGSRIQENHPYTGSYEYVQKLLSLGANKDFVPVEPDADSNLFTELAKKAIIERIGAKKGRGGTRVKSESSLMRKPSNILKSLSRASRGSKTPAGPRKAKEPTPADDYLQSGAIIIHASEIQNIKDSLADYIRDITPTAMREYELRRSKTTSPAEIARLANAWDKEGISDEEAGHRLTELLSAKDTPFHTFPVNKYGKKMVALLGYKEGAQDTPDIKEAKPSNGKVSVVRQDTRAALPRGRQLRVSDSSQALILRAF